MKFFNFIYMNRFTLIPLLTLFCFLQFSGTPPGKKFFTYRILQDGVEVPVKKNSVKLNKKPFVIEFHFSSPLGIFVSASFSNESYKASKSKKTFGEIPGFKATGMAESDFNKDHEILVNDEAPNYWYYENDKSNRFDEVSQQNGDIVCTRTIEQFYLVNTKETQRIEKAAHDLYLVFLVKQRGKSAEADKELQREGLIIKWN